MSGFGRARERIERLVTLAWILSGDLPVTLAHIRERYRLYADGSEQSSRRKFERDKDDLRSMGYDVQVVGDDGYRIAPDTSPTTTLRWSDAELDTLAVLAATIGDSATGTALSRLAAPTGQFPAERAGAQVHVDTELPGPVAQALADQRRLAFRYRSADGTVTERTVEPWQHRIRNGLAYLTAWDVGAQDERNFRVDRIVGAASVTDEPCVQERPAELGPLYPDETADVVLEADDADRRDAETLGGAVTAAPGDTGRLRIALRDARPEVAIGWALRRGAAIVEPAHLADELAARRRALVDLHTGPPTQVTRPDPPRAHSSTLTEARLQRMLSLPSWLGERPGVTLAEAAQAFGCSVEEITEELELLDLIDIPGIGSVVETEQHADGQIVFRLFRREPTAHLSPTDALRLLALVDAGSAVLSPEQAPALASIEQRLRAIVPSTVDLELSGERHPDLARLRHAIDTGLDVTFEYRGRKDATWRQRHVAPERFAVAHGAVYLTGIDLDAGQERHFRLDRLADVEVGQDMPSIAADTVPPTYTPSKQDVEVLLRMTTRATWILANVDPTASEATDDGGVVAVVPTDAVDWVVGHVLAAGGEAEVVHPPDIRAKVRDRAAAPMDG